MRCYGWTSGEQGEFISLLKLPPVDSAQKAVQVQIVKDPGKK
jgi:hypothetical protein